MQATLFAKKVKISSDRCLVFILRLLDCFLVESPATSLSISPVGDFLATAHVDDVGIYLW